MHGIGRQGRHLRVSLTNVDHGVVGNLRDTVQLGDQQTGRTPHFLYLSIHGVVDVGLSHCTGSGARRFGVPGPVMQGQQEGLRDNLHTQSLAQLTGHSGRRDDALLGFHQHGQTARDAALFSCSREYRCLHFHKCAGFKLRFTHKSKQGNDQRHWQTGEQEMAGMGSEWPPPPRRVAGVRVRVRDSFRCCVVVCHSVPRPGLAGASASCLARNILVPELSFMLYRPLFQELEHEPGPRSHLCTNQITDYFARCCSIILH